MKIGIIGVGELGSAYARRFQATGHEVYVADKDRGRLAAFRDPFVVCYSNTDLASKVDALIYSLDIPETVPAIRESLPAFRGRVVMDFTSVKTYAVEAMKQYAQPEVRIVSVHPMHRGLMPTFENQRLLEMPIRTDEETEREVRALFTPLGLEIVPIRYEDHDELSAKTQPAVHFVFTSNARGFMNAEIDPNRHPTYQNSWDKMKSRFTKRIIAQRPGVTAGIAIYNPHSMRYVSPYADATKWIVESQVSGQDGALSRAMLEVREHLKPHNLRLSWNLLRELFGGDFDFRKTDNSFASLMALGLSYKQIGFDPYDARNAIAQTPPYQIITHLMGAVFSDEPALRHFVNNAGRNPETRRQDVHFLGAVSQGEHLIRRGNSAATEEERRSHYDSYVDFLTETQGHFLKSDLNRAIEESNDDITRLAKLTNRK